MFHPKNISLVIVQTYNKLKIQLIYQPSFNIILVQNYNQSKYNIEMLKNQQLQSFDNYYPFSQGIPLDFPLNLNDFGVDPFKYLKQDHQVKIQQVQYAPKIEAKQFEYKVTNNHLKTQQLQNKENQQKSIQNHSDLLKRQNTVDSFTHKRNIVPNNINHIFAFIQRKNKSLPILERLLIKYNADATFTPKRFYYYQAQVKYKLNIHVNKMSLRCLLNHMDLESVIFPPQEQQFYNRICKVMVCYYLRAVANVSVLSSCRIRQTNKKDHLKAQRELLELVQEKESEK